MRISLRRKPVTVSPGLVLNVDHPELVAKLRDGRLVQGSRPRASGHRFCGSKTDRIGRGIGIGMCGIRLETV